MPATWFREVAIFAGATNSHDAVARGNCELGVGAHHSAAQLIAREPELHARFATLLAQRVRLLVDIIEDFTSLPMAARLAKRVLAQTEAYAIGSVVRRGCISQDSTRCWSAPTLPELNQEFRRWEEGRRGPHRLRRHRGHRPRGAGAGVRDNQWERLGEIIGDQYLQ